MKAILDNYLNNHYNEVERYTHYFLHRLKLNLDVSSVINNAYINYIDHQSQGKTPTIEHEVSYYFSHLIKCELLWTSETKKELITSVENHYLADEHIDSDSIIIDTTTKRRKIILEIYRNSLESKVKRIFFDTFIRLSEQKGKPFTIRELANHFNISIGTAHNMVKDMRNEINEIQKFINSNSHEN